MKSEEQEIKYIKKNSVLNNFYLYDKVVDRELFSNNDLVGLVIKTFAPPEQIMEVAYRSNNLIYVVGCSSIKNAVFKSEPKIYKRENLKFKEYNELLKRNNL